MRGSDIKFIRNRLQLSTLELGRALGMAGADPTVAMSVRRYESDQRPFPTTSSRLLEMFDEHGVPPAYLDTRCIRLEALRAQIVAETNVEKVCAALNEFEQLRKSLDADDIDADEFDGDLNLSWDIDQTWEDFRDTPFGVDATDVLFRDATGRYYSMSRADIEAGNNDE